MTVREYLSQAYRLEQRISLLKEEIDLLDIVVFVIRSYHINYAFLKINEIVDVFH